MSRFRLCLLGGFQVRMGTSSPVPLPVKAQALLAYLALRPHDTHPRDKLAALLWGDVPETLARDSLRHVVTTIRKALAHGDCAPLILEAQTVAVDTEALDVDVLEFRQCVSNGTPEALEHAVTLYRGDLLEGLALTEPRFEEWLLGEREQLRELVVDALSRQLGTHTEAGAVERAISVAGRLLTFDPIQEPMHRTLMRLYVQQGRRGSALKQYQTCVSLLQRELGVEPETDTKALYREILQGRPSQPSRHAASEGSGFTAPEAPLVGRDVELERLWTAMADAWSGRGSVTAIIGEAGVGKTSLLADVAAEVAQRDARLLVGRSYQSEKVLAFGPWIDALRHTGSKILHALSEPARLELSRLLPDARKDGDPPLPAGQDAARLFESVRQLLVRLASETPLVLMLEDLHWADDMSARLLAFLARRLETLPVLILCTARDEETLPHSVLYQVFQELSQDARVDLLAVRPLPQNDATMLVRRLTRSSHDNRTGTSLEELAWSLSQGNPFVLVETVRAFNDTEQAVGGALPQRIRDVMAARIGRLHPFGQHLSIIAAVIGRASDFALLTRVSGLSDGDAAGAIEELVRRRVFVDLGDRFDFVHDRLREVALAQLLPARVKGIHARIAEGIEAMNPSRLDEVCDQLAHHYAQTDQSEKAIGYLSRAAANAARAYAYEDAVALLKQAHGLALTGSADRPIVDLILRIAHLLYFLGRYKEARDLLVGEHARVERLSDPQIAGPYHFLFGRYCSLLGDDQLAVDYAGLAIEEATRCGDEATIGRAHFVLSYESLWAGRFREGAAQGLEGARYLERCGEHWWVGTASWLAGMNCLMMGEFEEALKAIARTKSIGARLEDDHLLSCAEWSSGWALAGLGDPDAGIASCKRALERPQDHFNRSRALSILGLVSLDRGDAAQAVQALEGALASMDGVGVRRLEGLFMGWLADAYQMNGESERARTRAREGIETTSLSRFPFGMGVAYRALGRTAWKAGDLQTAERELQTALQVFGSIDAIFEAARTRLDLASVSRALDNALAAQDHLAHARYSFETLRLPLYVARCC